MTLASLCSDPTANGAQTDVRPHGGLNARPQLPDELLPVAEVRLFGHLPSRPWPCLLSSVGRILRAAPTLASVISMRAVICVAGCS